MANRRHRADYYLALKSEFRLARESVGSQERFAGLTRVDQQTISLYENRNRPEFPALDVVADLLDITGSLPLVQLLADIVGAVVVPLPQGAGPVAIIESSGAMAQALGRAMVEIGQALADGAISPAEADAILPKLQSIIISAHALSEQIKREAGQ